MPASSKVRPTIWMPIGSPSEAPTGSARAGCPVRLNGRVRIEVQTGRPSRNGARRGAGPRVLAVTSTSWSANTVEFDLGAQQRGGASGGSEVAFGQTDPRDQVAEDGAAVGMASCRKIVSVNRQSLGLKHYGAGRVHEWVVGHLHFADLRPQPGQRLDGAIG